MIHNSLRRLPYQVAYVCLDICLRSYLLHCKSSTCIGSADTLLLLNIFPEKRMCWQTTSLVISGTIDVSFFVFKEERSSICNKFLEKYFFFPPPLFFCGGLVWRNVVRIISFYRAWEEHDDVMDDLNCSGNHEWGSMPAHSFVREDVQQKLLPRIRSIPESYW